MRTGRMHYRLLLLTIFIYTELNVGQNWIEQAILTASNKERGDCFGYSVSLTDSYALVGAPGADPGGITNSGAAYIFIRVGTAWTQQAILTASDKSPGDELGQSASLIDEYALVGAIGKDLDGISDTGAAYLFVRTDATWTEQAILTASDKAMYDYLGGSVFLTSDAAFIGTYKRGSTYKFTRFEYSWTESEIIDTCCPQSIRETENYKISGDPEAPVDGMINAGRAVVFLNEIVSDHVHTRQISHNDTDTNQVSKGESSKLVPIIAGSSAAAIGLVAIIFCLRKRMSDKSKQSSAASWVESYPSNGIIQSGKDFLMSHITSRRDESPEKLGSIFMSKNSKVPHPPISDEASQVRCSNTNAQEKNKSVSSSSQQFNITEVSFSNLEPIGSGAFGLVYRVQLSNGIVAVKVPKSNYKIGSKEYNDMLSEAEFLSKLRHTNITLLLGYGHHPSGTIVFLMEFADCSLADMLKAGPLKSDLLINYAHGIVRGLLYLHIHSPPISHRDLKPENVLIVGGIAKLADFGLATARENISKETGFAGTPVWSPPESFDGRFPGPPGDIYTFGLLLWSMTTGKIPYEGVRFEGIYSVKTKNLVPDIPSSCPPNLSKVIRQCWKTNPKQRPKAYDLEKAFDEVKTID